LDLILFLIIFSIIDVRDRDQKIELYRDQDRDQRKNFSRTRSGTEKKITGIRTK
jgi:hypothetical protein